jgi:hypothetical protein
LLLYNKLLFILNWIFIDKCFFFMIKKVLKKIL